MKILEIGEAEALNTTIEILRNGGVAVLPTDTAYALCADATNDKAVEKIFEIKSRPQEKSLPVFINSKEEVEKYAFFTKTAEKYAEKFWPGALTLVLKSKPGSSIKTVAKDKTVCIRIPDSKFLMNVVKNLNKPITSTSANASGKDSCYSLKETRESLGDKFNLVNLAIDGGELEKRPVSTIVKIVKDHIEILREGAISREEIKSMVG